MTLFSLLWAATSYAFSSLPAERAHGPVPPPTQPPFYWTRPSQAPPAGREPQPSLPDLSVQWIERRPRYQRFCLDYSRGLPELCPGTENDQRYPQPGEIVTFTAHIANQGLLTSTAVSATWLIQSAQAATRHPSTGALAREITANLPALAPGLTTTLSLTWPWSTAPHTVTLTLDPLATLSETTRANNRLSHLTSGLYLEVLVHPYVNAAFAARRNLVGSWSFADWIQAQLEAMNGRLAAAVYPDAPTGVLDRVRIDRIRVTREVGGDIVSSTLDFDGRWTFRVEQDDPDTPEEEGVVSAEDYARAFARTIDWGLIHELTHQLGIIDLYQLNVAASDQNEVMDADGRPLLMGFQWSNPGLMGGGDRNGHSWPAYSRHTALALNRNAGYRRGYFGEYLFDIPPAASLRALDNRGQPLADAQIRLYQTEANVVRAAPVITGTLDSAGRFELPARPVPLGGLTTATGHTLAASPFGAIDVVGRNGQLLVEIRRDDQRFYAWWPITDFNLAAWQGLATYERVITTHLPAADAPLPPARLDGRVDGLIVTLYWSPSPDENVVAYRVYRGQAPAFYPLLPLTTTQGLTYSGLSDRTARYAVTAVDRQGRESGFSPIFRAQRTVYPVGVAVDPASGRRIILDRHDGALITQLADDRWVGRQGSVHVGLTGAEALARNAQGQLFVPVSGSNRLKVLNPVGQLINWFGQERFVTGTLHRPAGVAQAGEPFTISLKPVADDQTLGLASFDGQATLSGELPLLLDGVTLVPGRFGQAVLVDDADRLLYKAAGRLNFSQGSVQLWVRPGWPWNDDQEHVFLEIGQEPLAGYRLRLAKADWNGLYAWIRDGPADIGHDLVLYADVQDWQPDQWHHLAVAWQAAQPDADYRRYTLWVDGVLQDSQVTRRPVVGPMELISVGAGLDGRDQAEAALDELHLSNVARVGNSQRVRLLVSEGDADRVDVFDWLGNLVSSFGHTGSDAGEFQQPQELLLADDTVMVADAGNGRIALLGFDGNRVGWQTSWQEGLLRPRGLATLPDGRVLVSDQGDNQVKLLNADGTLLRRWTHPSDGHPGAFWQPAGIAVLPGGDALVADAGNGRVVRLVGPLGPARQFLPVVTRGRLRGQAHRCHS